MHWECPDPAWRNCTSGESSANHDNLIGMAIAVGANTIIPVGLALQKQAHRRSEQSTPPIPFAKLPIWWLGLMSMVGGELFNLLAYGYAPTSLVAPVGAIGVLVNGLLATLCMKEAFGWRDAVGLVCIAGGVILVVWQVPTVQLSLTPVVIKYCVFGTQPRAYGYVVFTALFVPLWWLRIVPRYKARHPAVYLLLCSAIASITVVSARAFGFAFTTAAETGDYLSLVRDPVPPIALLLIVITAVSSTFYLQKAMALFPNNQVVPVYYVTFTLASVMAGATVYHEFDCMSPTQPPLFTAGCLTTFIGVFLTASKGGGGQGGSLRTVPRDLARRVAGLGGVAISGASRTAPRQLLDDATPRSNGFTEEVAAVPPPRVARE